MSTQIEGRETDPDPAIQSRIRQLKMAERRALLLVRALSAFYLSVGSFAGASLVSLLGAVFHIAHNEALRTIALSIGLGGGIAGVGGLVVGCGLLVFETRLTLSILRDETRLMLGRLPNSNG